MKNRSHKSRNIDDHKGDSFVTKDENKHAWEGQELEVHSDPLVEQVGGEPVILRMFEFVANPELLKLHKPTKQQLFNNHAKQIEVSLWQDGLEPMHQISPKVNTSKKREKYRIFVTCKPRKGVMLSYKDHPKTLQEITSNSNVRT